jgi:predicted GIY-YIG superfamily endonuclease
LAKRAEVAAPKRSEGGGLSVKYVYILESVGVEAHYYVGLTGDVAARLIRHNRGEVRHTAKFAPWRLKTYVAFADERRAVSFERYLKTASGRAFSKKRL